MVNMIITSFVIKITSMCLDVVLFEVKFSDSEFVCLHTSCFKHNHSSFCIFGRCACSESDHLQYSVFDSSRLKHSKQHLLQKVTEGSWIQRTSERKCQSDILSQAPIFLFYKTTTFVETQ